MENFFNKTFLLALGTFMCGLLSCSSEVFDFSFLIAIILPFITFALGFFYRKMSYKNNLTNILARIGVAMATYRAVVIIKALVIALSYVSMT